MYQDADQALDFGQGFRVVISIPTASPSQCYREVRAAAVPASILTDVPTPERLGSTVTIWLEEAAAVPDD